MGYSALFSRAHGDWITYDENNLHPCQEYPYTDQKWPTKGQHSKSTWGVNLDLFVTRKISEPKGQFFWSFPQICVLQDRGGIPNFFFKFTNLIFFAALLVIKFLGGFNPLLWVNCVCTKESAGTSLSLKMHFFFVWDWVTHYY